MIDPGASRFASKKQKERAEDAPEYSVEELDESRRNNPYEYYGWGTERYALHSVAEQVALLRFQLRSMFSKDKAEYTPLWQPGQKLPGQQEFIEIDPTEPGFSLESLGL